MEGDQRTHAALGSPRLRRREDYFTVASLALGAAGAVLTWTAFPVLPQKLTVAALLLAAMGLSILACKALHSQHEYLKGFYGRRGEIETDNPGLKLRNSTDSGETIPTLKKGFAIVIPGSVLLLGDSVPHFKRPLLKGARLTGADLSTVVGLSQMDLEGACGSKETKLPSGLSIPDCK